MNVESLLQWLPARASEAAQRTDMLFLAVLAITGLVTFGIFAV